MNDPYNTSGEGAGTAARMQEAVSDKAKEAKDSVVEYGRQTIDKIDASRGPAASALDQTASVLHEQSDKPLQWHTGLQTRFKPRLITSASMT